TSLLLRTSGLLPLVRSAVTARVRVARVVGVAAIVVEVELGSSGGGSSGGGGGGWTGGGSGGSGGGGGGSSGSGGSGGSGTGGCGTGAPHVGSGGGQRQQQQRRSETQSPQQLRERFLRGPSRGSCTYVIRTGVRAGQTCEKLHTQHHCFSRLDDAWRAEFGDDVQLPRWVDLLSAEGDCYRCVPPDPGIAAAALGASESGTLPSTAPAQALHTFTLDSGASRCFFRDSTTLTPLPAPVSVRLADPSRGPVVAHSSTVLPCAAVPSGSLSGLHLPSFSTNLVSTAALQDAMVTTTTPGGQRVSNCTCTRTERHLATFTRRPGSTLYTLTTEPLQVATFAQVSVSGQVAATCLCRLLSHQNLLWHHRLGHPLLRDFCCGEGILQSFTLPESPQQNGIAERRIGLVMIHAAAPHFLWSFAVRYAVHQLNLWPRVSLPETSPTLCWTGEVGDALVFRVLGSRAFVRNTFADMLSACAIPCVFLGFVTDVPGWQIYHPTLRRVLLSQDVMFDEPVSFY
ncbi:unnamed protein product, partial [Closterium sp. NIES-54]